MTKPYLSVVVPIFNEEANVERLYEAIVACISDFGRDSEIIFVDDGSTDTSFQKAGELAARDSRLKLIRFRRNFGQTPAMAAGIDHASGEIIVTMDGDLQNDPRDIPTLVERIESGSDLAVGWRHKRQDKLISRKVPSWIANWLIGKVTGVPIKDNGCSLKAYRAELIQRVPLYSEMHRFIPAMSSIAGARIAEVKVRHHARQFGTSKYGLSRIYKVLLDMIAIKTITSFSQRALRWFALLALPFAAISLICLVWALWLWFETENTIVVVSGLVVVYAGGAAFLVICGVLSELVYKTGEIRPEDFFKVRTNSHDTTRPGRGAESIDG
ncbi:MAG: glycosyltransferase family 2 protein [Gammaproteobacteria bacterium]|nr:glycosyltransferase family 2 protein [Gammaproteobacteria bacterium]NNL51707.1 glycosyltransferase family 2 protein [Woeseiaceae bacterium]